MDTATMPEQSERRKMTQSELIFKIYVLVNKFNVCPSTKPHEWVKTLLYLHSKGWLWSSIDDDNNVVMTAAMYRIPAVESKYTDELPEKEEGNILYVPFFVSVSDDPMQAKRVLTKYLDDRKDIEKIAIFSNSDSNNLVVFDRAGG